MRTRGYADAAAAADADGIRTKNNVSPPPWLGDINTAKHGRAGVGRQVYVLVNYFENLPIMPLGVFLVKVLQAYKF